MHVNADYCIDKIGQSPSLESETIILIDLDLLIEPRMETRLRLRFPVAESVGKVRPNIFLKVEEVRRDCSFRNLNPVQNN